MEDDRLNELVAYTRRDLAARGVVPGDGSEIHVHYHAPAPVAEQKRSSGDELLSRATPYFVLLLGGCIVLAVLAVALLMLTPVLMAIMGGMVSLVIAAAAALGAVAVLMIGGSAAIRNLRETHPPAKRRRRR